jgi:hypothetical protein
VVAARGLRAILILTVILAANAAAATKYRHDYIASSEEVTSRWHALWEGIAATWPIALWSAVVSLSIIVFRWAVWRYYVAAWCIAAAVAIIYLDRIVVPASPTEIYDSQGFTVEATLLESGRTNTDIVMGTPPGIAVTLNRSNEIVGSLSLFGDGSGDFLIDFPAGTKITSAVAVDHLKVISNDEVTAAQFSVGPYRFASELYFEWTGHLSDSAGIGRSIYHVRYSILGDLTSSDLYPYAGTRPRLTIDLPSQHQHFLELDPPATGAPRFQSRSWDLIDTTVYGVDVDATVSNETLRLFVDYSINLLFLGFGFFLGSVSWSP